MGSIVPLKILSLALCSFEHVAWRRHRSYEVVGGADDEMITYKSMPPVAKLQVYVSPVAFHVKLYEGLALQA